MIQNGAPFHTDLKSWKLINDNLPNRAVGKYFSVSWPHYSPDLNPADFWLWPALKKIIFCKNQAPYTSVLALKQAITFGFNRLRRQVFPHLTSAVGRRLRKRVEAQGFRSWFIINVLNIYESRWTLFIDFLCKLMCFLSEGLSQRMQSYSKIYELKWDVVYNINSIFTWVAPKVLHTDY